MSCCEFVVTMHSASSPFQCTRRLHYCSSMLSTPEASRAVFEDAAGTLAGVFTGKFVIDCATLAESDMKRMGQQVHKKGG